MARCEGTTRDGDQCKREARSESQFCYLHGSAESAEEEAPANECEAVEWNDVLPVLLAGAATIGLLLVFKTLGRFIPKG
jgi:hypothetical protein